MKFVSIRLKSSSQMSSTMLRSSVHQTWPHISFSQDCFSPGSLISGFMYFPFDHDVSIQVTGVHNGIPLLTSNILTISACESDTYFVSGVLPGNMPPTNQNVVYKLVCELLNAPRQQFSIPFQVISLHSANEPSSTINVELAVITLPRQRQLNLFESENAFRYEELIPASSSTATSIPVQTGLPADLGQSVSEPAAQRKSPFSLISSVFSYFYPRKRTHGSQEDASVPAAPSTSSSYAASNQMSSFTDAFLRRMMEPVFAQPDSTTHSGIPTSLQVMSGEFDYQNPIFDQVAEASSSALSPLKFRFSFHGTENDQNLVKIAIHRPTGASFVLGDAIRGYFDFRNVGLPIARLSISLTTGSVSAETATSRIVTSQHFDCLKSAVLPFSIEIPQSTSLLPSERFGKWIIRFKFVSRSCTASLELLDFVDGVGSRDCVPFEWQFEVPIQIDCAEFSELQREQHRLSSLLSSPL